MAPHDGQRNTDDECSHGPGEAPPQSEIDAVLGGHSLFVNLILAAKGDRIDPVCNRRTGKLCSVDQPQARRGDDPYGSRYAENSTDNRNNRHVLELPGEGLFQSSSRGESHPPALTEPDVNLSAHPALAGRLGVAARRCQ